MQVCPLDYRYGRSEMKRLFDEEEKLRKYLEVEAALARAHAAVGNIPEEAAERISEMANTDRVRLSRVKEIEGEIKHDIMAVVKALSEQCGDAGKYVHLGATSNDIIDTSNALQMKDAIDIIEEDLVKLREVFVRLAEKHKNTLQVGRTHGQFAVPTTFGLKLAVYALEVDRHIDRLKECRKRVGVGKMMGAVGTGAALGEKAPEIQSLVMKDIGLEPALASLQIVGRDRYAELVYVLGNISSSLEKFATEVRNLQRSEIGEVFEAFDEKKQVGSSTMAHKRNPITSENICGLARVVRGFVGPAFENIPLWHERDLTNSSAERFILPHVCVLTDDILVKSIDVFSNIKVDENRMSENIKRARGLIMAEPVMMALVRKGMGRQEAHEAVRKCSMKAEREGSFSDVLLSDEVVSKHLSQEELKRALDPASYIGSAVEVVERVVSKLREK